MNWLHFAVWGASKELPWPGFIQTLWWELQISGLNCRDTPGGHSGIPIARVLNQDARLSIGRGLKSSNPTAGLIQTATEPNPAALFPHGPSLPLTNGKGQTASQIDVACVDEPSEAKGRGHLLATEAVLMGRDPIHLVLGDHATAE